MNRARPELFRICETWRQANDEVKEKVVAIESSWVTFTHQAKVLLRLKSTINPEHFRVLEDLLEVLV